jgi:hypothetical protein
MNSTSPPNFADAGNGQNLDTTPQFFQPADLARGRCCTATVHRIAAFLGLAVNRTATGTRIFSREQARSIVAEIERRREEATR